MGIAAFFIAIQPREAETKGTGEPVKVTTDYDTVLVPTPTRPIAKGEKLSSVPFTNVKWPKSRLTEDYILELDAYQESIATTALPKYLPVPVSAVTSGAFESNAVVEGIPEGMRAITVRVDEEAAVEGWARSGNYVDVIVIRSSKDSSVGLEAKVIAENVRILSAERSAAPLTTSGTAPKAPRTVTLLTSQEDALKIATAANIGKLTFALRGMGDQNPTLSTAMDQRKLLGEARTLRQVEEQFRGFARGPDGKVYVLSDDEMRWTLTPEVPTTAPDDFQRSARGKLNDEASR